MMKFEEGYFCQSKISNYEDYKKRKFVGLAKDLIKTASLSQFTKVLDFGCATGGMIAELKEFGITNIKGTDISYWSISYGKKRYNLDKELEYYNVNLLTEKNNVVFFLDVLEHVPTKAEIEILLDLINSDTIIIRVPVSKIEGERYVLDVSMNDATHVQCHNKEWWKKLLLRYDFKLKKVIKGKMIYDSEGVLARIYEKKRID